MKVLLVLLLMQPSSMPISQLPTKVWWQWCCCHFGSMSMLLTMMLLSLWLNVNVDDNDAVAT